MSFFAQYPASSSGSNASVGGNGSPAPAYSTEVAGIDSLGNLVPIKVDSAGVQEVNVSSSVLPADAATASNQVLEIADLDAIKLSVDSIDTKLTNPLPVSGPLTDTELRASAVPVSGPLTDVELRATPVPISGTVSTGGLTDVELRASAVPVSLASAPLPTGAATEATLSSFSSKSPAGFVPEAFDETVTTYVGATTKINTVTYKLATVTVATLTMSYDGSDRLTGVVKS